MSKFVSKTYKSGDSLVAVIPSSVVKANNIEKGDEVLFDIKKKIR